LPVNLDFTFSREQRDKVYVQHVMRQQGSQLWRWLDGGALPCVCEAAAEEAADHGRGGVHAR
jgi:sulfite reductase alpha subunit-like flavoprotein